MTLEEAQSAVDRWITSNGGYFDTAVNLARLLEEAGELSHDLLRSSGKLKPAQGAPLQSAEFGDVLFVLCALANQHNVSLSESLQTSLDKFKARDPDRHK